MKIVGNPSQPDQPRQGVPPWTSPVAPTTPVPPVMPGLLPVTEPVVAQEAPKPASEAPITSTVLPPNIVSTLKAIQKDVQADVPQALGWEEKMKYATGVLEDQLKNRARHLQGQVAQQALTWRNDFPASVRTSPLDAQFSGKLQALERTLEGEHANWTAELHRKDETIQRLAATLEDLQQSLQKIQERPAEQLAPAIPVVPPDSQAPDPIPELPMMERSVPITPISIPEWTPMVDPETASDPEERLEPSSGAPDDSLNFADILGDVPTPPRLYSRDFGVT